MFPFRRSLIRRSVVVNLMSGRSFRGVLWAKRGPLLVLRDATLLDGGQTMTVDGEVVVERRMVEWVQVLAS